MGKYDSTRFYWLQLREDFFDDDAISWIEEQPNGKEYSLFYLKLCLKSLKTNGIMIRRVGEMLIPYDYKKLAEITKTPPDTVLVAMELFQKIGLVKTLENGELYMTQVENMIGSQSIGAFKKQQQRRNCLPQSTTSGQLEDKCPTEIEKEKEIEKELEIETEKKRNIDYLGIVNMFNDTCVSFPSVKSLSEKRKKAIKARFNSGYTFDNFKTLFQKAQASDFLKGKNKRNWQANFDWLIKDENMAKVIDGNFDNRSTTYNNNNQYSNQGKVITQEEYEKPIEEVMAEMGF